VVTEIMVAFVLEYNSIQKKIGNKLETVHSVI